MHPAALPPRSDADASLQPAGWLPLVGMYALYVGTVGVLLPYHPAYLKSLSLTGLEVGLLLALGPLMVLCAPSFFAQWADRSGRLDRVLTVISCGAFLGLLPLLFVSRFVGLAIALMLYNGFASSMTSLLDGLALHRVGMTGGTYARLRLFGSLGFVCSSLAFGLFSTPTPSRLTVMVPLTLVALYAGWSLTVRSRAPVGEGVGRFAALSLLRDRDILLLLLASMTHWMACAPFHGTFSIHLNALNLAPSVVGLSAALGVVAEIAVMYLYPAFSEKIAPRHLLALAFAASAVRWWGMSQAHSANAIIALSALHGLTFGAFYIAAVAFLARRVPSHLRASGQALFGAVTFGVGGLAGYPLAGKGYDLLGGHRLFMVAAVVELVAAGLVLFVQPAVLRAGNKP
ncbi:MAG: MFS transporter [Myxococcaceae bacterium]